MEKTATILLVEDAFDDREVMTRILQHEGFKTLAATDGNEALQLLAEAGRPDLIVMDLALPGRDGWETLDAIRNNPDYAAIPVIATTAYGSLDVKDDIDTAGFDAYFPKPVQNERFVALVRQILWG
jgi:two-component system, cell cycle response regulator DivK